MDADEESVRDVDEVIWRIHHGHHFDEDELVDAAEILGTRMDREDAREAAEIVLRRLAASDANGSAYGLSIGQSSASGAARPLGRRRLHGASRIETAGATAFAALAVILWFAMAPDDVPDRSVDVTMALSDHASDNARTDGAPQQSVVNGWVAKDLLAIVARQANDSARADRQAADRLAAEAVLVVVTLTFGIATRPPAARRPT